LKGKEYSQKFSKAPKKKLKLRKTGNFYATSVFDKIVLVFGVTLKQMTVNI